MWEGACGHPSWDFQRHALLTLLKVQYQPVSHPCHWRSMWMWWKKLIISVINEEVYSRGSLFGDGEKRIWVYKGELWEEGKILPTCKRECKMWKHEEVSVSLTGRSFGEGCGSASERKPERTRRKWSRDKPGEWKHQENEMKEEVQWKGKLSIDVEQKVNNDGMIRLSPYNQPVVILPYELSKKGFYQEMSGKESILVWRVH